VLVVYVLLAEGFEEIEALAPVDFLRRAEVDVVTVSLTPDLTVTGGHGVKVKADITIDKIGFKALEMLIIPGGLGGVNTIAKSTAAMELINNVWQADKKVAAICAAPILLARLGLLNGLSVVCYPSVGEDIAAAGAKYISDKNVVTDRNLTTGKAAGSSIDFSLELIFVLSGAEKAEQIRTAICL